MINILIIGKGYIGRNLATFLTQPDISIYNIEKSDLDYWSYDNLDQYIQSQKNKGITFSFIINCTGFYGDQINECNHYPRLFLHLTATLPIILSNLCTKHNCKYIHLSSADIYNGDNAFTKDEIGSMVSFALTVNEGWSENNLPNHGIFANKSSTFSKTHHVIENCLRGLNNVYILRIKNCISGIFHKKNYLLKVITKERIINKENSVTFLPDLFNFINEILKASNIPTGIYNIVNGECFFNKIIFDELKNYTDEFENLKIFFNRKALIDNNLKLSPERPFAILKNTKASKYINFTKVDNQLINKCLKEIIEDKKINDYYFSVHNEKNVSLRDESRYSNKPDLVNESLVEKMWNNA